LKLTEKPVRRIYRLDIDELNAQIKALEDEIETVKFNLEHLTDYAVAYYEGLLKKYGKGRERRTEIRQFDVITARSVAIANTKVYMNRSEGFVGLGLKKDELIAECSELDDIIVFTKSGKMKVVRVADKVFIGKDIIHAAVFQKNDERTTYNVIYVDGATGVSFAKRFNVTGITRDKEYDITKGSEKSRVHYFSANHNGEAETVKIILSPNSNAKKKEFDFYFEELDIKGRSSMGNQVTKHPIKTVKFKEAGRSTLTGRKLWFDSKFGRLNNEEKGEYLGTFEDEKLLVIYDDGNYEITDTELTQRFEPEKILLIEKFNPDKPITAVYLDTEKGQYNIKRFKIETTSIKTKVLFIKEGKGNRLEAVTSEEEPVLLLHSQAAGKISTQKIQIAGFVEVMGWKAIGNKLVNYSKDVEMEWEAKADEGDMQAKLF
jgi:topoisomerase-4 subunit A